MHHRAVVLLFGFLIVAESGVIAYFVKSKTVAGAKRGLSLAVDVPPSAVKPITRSVSPFNWSTVESADYKSYIANLRAIGCPEETVRDIIIADIDKLLASRSRVVTPRKAAQYWQPEEREVTTTFSDDAGRDDQALEKEKRDLVKQLLGIDYIAERRKLHGEEDATDRRLAFLPEAKREQLRALLEKYSALERDFHNKTAPRRGALTAEDRGELKSIREGRQAEVASLLSPREVELYELWMSNAAVAARFAMGGIDHPREQDFLTIYNIRKRTEFDPETVDANDPAVLEKWTRASAAAEDQIRTQLGEERYAQYQRGQDASYRQLVEIARQYQLPQTAAGKIYDLKKQVEAAAAKMISDQSVSEPDRIATLGPMRREAEESVRGLLGETAYQQYRRYGNADWLQSN